MMRVGYVLKVYPRLSQTFVVNELRAHEAAGLPVTIFSLRPPRDSDANVVNPPLAAQVVTLDGPDHRLGAQLAEAAAARGIAHFHAHFAKIATNVAREAAQRLRIPFSFTAHAKDIYEQTVDTGRLQTSVRDAAQVITVSQFNVEYLEERYGRRPSLVYNGLPMESFPYRTPAVRERLVLAVGRLIEKKGFDVLIDACACLASEGTSFRCVIVGDGDDREALMARVGRLGLTDHVLLVGARPPDQVKVLMQEAAVLVVPCVVAGNGDRDGLPTVLLEAMALGTPCIGTDVTGIPEALVDEVTGLMVPQRDPVGLARACRRLLGDATLRSRLAEQARLLVERRFSSEANTRRLRALWGAAPLRVLFRVYNKRGLGHWMRGVNVARELLVLEPNSDIRFLTRTPPPFPIDDSRITSYVAADPHAMDVLSPELAAFAPDVIVDDTILPARLTCEGARHVFVMRRCTPERQAQVFAHSVLSRMDAVIVPHTPDDFGYAVPDAIGGRVTFVGPIARRARPEAMVTLRKRLGLEAEGFCLVSSPGGGGFEDDGVRFAEIASRIHVGLAQRLPGFHHVFVLGPNSSLSMAPIDAQMTVLESEADMSSLFACADAVVSAGGYNSVSEIRFEKRPAFFLPGLRTHDDQRQRVEDLAARGLALVLDPDNPAVAAGAVVAACVDGRQLDAMRAAYEHDEVVPGNRDAARVILACGRR